MNSAGSESELASLFWCRGVTAAPAANEDDSAAKWQGRRIQRPREVSGEGNYTDLDQWVITEGLGVFMGARSLPE